MNANRRSWIEWGAFSIGAVVALLSLAGWRIAGGREASAATVSLVAARSAEIDVRPAGVVLTKNGLKPSSSRAGGVEQTLSARNATAHALSVRLRATASSHDLDDVLAVRASVDGRVLYRGSLAGFRHGTRSAFALASHQTAQVRLAAWIPRDVRRGYQARIAQLTLELVTRSGTGSR
jgi:hypothetical protein